MFKNRTQSHEHTHIARQNMTRIPEDPCRLPFSLSHPPLNDIHFPDF